MTGTSLELRVFLFADLESSTRLWQAFPDAMEVAMARHDAILREAIEQCGGQVIKGTGDGLMAVFASAADAVSACLNAQRELQQEAWGETGPLRVRMGMHVGEAQPRAGDFYGPAVNRAARIMGAAHGGQVLLSGPAADLAMDRLPSEAELRNLGEHRLKDLIQPEHLYQLVHPALRDDFPPLVTLSRRPNNLPVQTSEFLGREAQLGAIRRLLDSASVRLVTLTGPGGIGKTRLALQAAAEQVDRFEDGVYFVDLSAVPEPEGVFEAIVRAVDLTGTSDDRPLDLLKQQLCARQLLLLLDNFEQVIDAADGVAELLQQCPDLNILITSREALRVRGEHLFPVPPLSLPDSSGQPSVDDVAGFEAVRLFVERARQAQPDFALNESNAGVVADVCTQLDGLPLAIELAVSRLRLFSLEDLRDRLRTRLELLRGGPRDLPARQRTLRSTIEWSYELLDDEERAVFQLLSVFAPTHVDAIEEVASRLEPLEEIDVIDRLMSLVDKSLVRNVEAAGRQQLAMLETIREYAAERLADEPEIDAAAQGAHAEYFVDFAQGKREKLFGARRDETLDELEAEHGNLAKAWRFWADAGDLEQLNQLLGSLWTLYDAHGWYHTAVELTNDLLTVLTRVPESRDRAREEIAVRASLARGLLAIRGYTEEVEAAYLSALALSKELGELPQRFPVLRSIASFYLYRGEFEKSAEIGRELLHLAEQQDDVAVQVDGHLLVGSGLTFSGDVPTGLEHLEQAITLFDASSSRDHGHFRFGPNPGIVACTTAAALRWLHGYPDTGAALASKALDWAQQLDHPYSLAYALFHTGFLARWRGDLAQMYELAEATLHVAEEHDFQIWTALALLLRGAAMTGTGRAEAGFVDIERGISLYQGTHTPPIFWPLLLYVCATGNAWGGRAEEGLKLIDQALGMVDDENFLFPEFALLRGELFLALGEITAAAASFRSTIEVAGRQSARTSQLRAASQLVRLQQPSAQSADGLDTLRDVYTAFTEGFDTPDLTQARKLLGDHNTPVM